MAAAVLRYGFLDLKLPRIAGMANLQNHASQRVLLKVGLVRRGERAFPHPDYASEGAMAWFERDAADWQAERGSAAERVNESVFFTRSEGLHYDSPQASMPAS